MRKEAGNPTERFRVVRAERAFFRGNSDREDQGIRACEDNGRNPTPPNQRKRDNFDYNRDVVWMTNPSIQATRDWGGARHHDDSRVPALAERYDRGISKDLCNDRAQ